MSISKKLIIASLLISVAATAQARPRIEPLNDRTANAEIRLSHTGTAAPVALHDSGAMMMHPSSTNHTMTPKAKKAEAKAKAEAKKPAAKHMEKHAKAKKAAKHAHKKHGKKHHAKKAS